MPEISRFFGIIIRMFVEVGGPHHRPHFHAYYQDQAAVFAIDSLECLGGELPKAQQRLVEAWAELHREELQQDWDEELELEREMEYFVEPEEAFTRDDIE